MDLLPNRVESGRLLLRAWAPEDAAAMSAAIAASLDHLRPWMPWVAYEPVSLAGRRSLIEQWNREWSTGGDSVLGVFRDGAVVGGAGLHRRVGPNAVEIGYWIHIDRLRRGYATEAARALTDAAFTVHSIDRVEIRHDEANEVSGRVPARLGYMFAGSSRRDPEAPGEVGVQYRWVVERKEWPSLTKEPPSPGS